MAPKTDSRLTRDLMLDAVPYSSDNILFTREIWSPGGMMREIIEVPFPRAASKFLMSFFTLNISICVSLSSAIVMNNYYYVATILYFDVLDNWLLSSFHKKGFEPFLQY